MLNDIVKIALTILVITALVIGCILGIGYGLMKASTVEGNFIIIPETGTPFHVKKVIFMSSTSVTYYKDDGTGGRISGNFRVEDAPKNLENNK